MSCICVDPRRKEGYGATRRSDGGYDWKIHPDCVYHQVAAEFPDDHSIPWNCPTYWDGCNCRADSV